MQSVTKLTMKIKISKVDPVDGFILNGEPMKQYRYLLEVEEYKYWLRINGEIEDIGVLPKAPLSSIIKEGSLGTCPNCRSTEIKRFIFFGKSIGCIQPKCKNYYKRYE